MLEHITHTVALDFIVFRFHVNAVHLCNCSQFTLSLSLMLFVILSILSLMYKMYMCTNVGYSKAADTLQWLLSYMYM